MNASVKLIESVLPASVGLRVTVPETHPSVQILGTERHGSGTFLDTQGIILTVNYIVLGAISITVTLVDGTELPGTVVAQDFYSGLAAVRVAGAGFPAAKTSRQVEIGQEVFILASTGGVGRRINSGVVFALEPFDAYWEYQLDRSIYTTAMNPGLGGGALYSLSGHLIGIVSLDLRDIGRFTLAIPADLFVDHQAELLQYGHRVSRPSRAWVGLFCYEIREHVVVGGLLPGGPGEQAGLRPGDVILSLNGEAIYRRRMLYQHLWTYKPGDVITFEVFRERAVQRVDVRAVDVEQFFAVPAA